MPKRNMDEDFELIEAWQAGDAKAGGQLVERYFSRVYRFFSSKVGDAAEELTQRTFLGCLESWVRGGPDTGSFSAYLFGVARKHLLRYFRERHREHQGVDVGDLSLEALAVAPSQAAAGAEEQRILLNALRRIPLDHQITLELFYWEEMAVADIAAVLEVAPGTIKSRLHRAREMLKNAVLSQDISDDLRHSTLTKLDDWARGLREILANYRNK